MVFEFFLAFTRLVLMVMIDIRVRGKGGGLEERLSLAQILHFHTAS